VPKADTPKREAPKPKPASPDPTKPDAPKADAAKPDIRKPAPRPALSGVVESFNTRTFTLEVRADRLYLVDAKNARFEAAGTNGARAAEYVDLRPGCQVQVNGRVSGPGVLIASGVRIVGLPARSGTKDPFLRPEPAAAKNEDPSGGEPPAIPAPGEGFAGTLIATDMVHVRITVRDGEEERAVSIQGAKIVRKGAALAAKDLKLGMKLIVTGRERDGVWFATQVEIL
jgi:hypothetical protein